VRVSTGALISNLDFEIRLSKCLSSNVQFGVLSQFQTGERGFLWVVESIKSEFTQSKTGLLIQFGVLCERVLEENQADLQVFARVRSMSGGWHARAQAAALGRQLIESLARLRAFVSE
jgi:hypothetical protein